MKKKLIARIIVYLLGLIILSLGIILNTKTDLGVSPIISVAFVTSTLQKWDFSNTTFLLYTLFVVIEIIVHLCKKQAKTACLDILQIPLSYLCTRFIHLFDKVIPVFTETGDSIWNTMAMRIIFLIIAIICTGIGVCLSVGMNFVPNPGDGIVATLADLFHKRLGLMKNIFDCCCVALSTILGFIFGHTLIGIGIGTVLSMIGVGRVVAIFNHFVMGKIKRVTF